MDEVYEFLSDFLVAQNAAINQERIPDLEAYNQAVHQMYSFTIPSMFEGLGIVLYEELESDRYYERVKNMPPNNPGKVFKLSHYQHDEWDDVWIGYASSSASGPELILNLAYFVIPDPEHKFLIARRYYYTQLDQDRLLNYESQWEGAEGINKLTFESLGGLKEVKRYLEPYDLGESRKIYEEEK